MNVMKRILLFFLILSIPYGMHAAQDTSDPKTQTIQVKTNLSSKRGKVYMKVYPYEQKKGCKKRKYDLSHKGSKDITITSDCCWKELRVSQVSKRNFKKVVLGKVTTQEPSCQHEKLLLTIDEGPQEKGKKFRPVDLEIKPLGKKSKKSPEEE